ncbi:MAG: hypothetical protein ACI845_004212, partial [Gammaproteobacteria bacterium]
RIIKINASSLAMTGLVPVTPIGSLIDPYGIPAINSWHL